MGEGRTRGLKLADTRPCGVPGQNLPRGRIQTAGSMRLPTLAEEIALDALLLGPGGVGLDSIDALQWVVALDTHVGIKITDPGTANAILQNGLTWPSRSPPTKPPGYPRHRPCREPALP